MKSKIKKYDAGVTGFDQITEETMAEIARSLIKGDLLVRKANARRFTINGTKGPIVRGLTAAQVGNIMDAASSFYVKNGSIHMGQRFLFRDIKKPDLTK